MSDTESATSSDIPKHCCKDDLMNSLSYVMSLVNNCQECKKMRLGLKKQLKINLNDNATASVCNFFSCSKCIKITSVIENCIDWKYYSLMEIQTYYFVKFNPFPSYEFIKNEIFKGLITYTEFEHKMLKWLYDNLDNADVFFDFKYFHCGKNPHRLNAYYNILKEVIFYIMDNTHGSSVETHHYLYDCDFGFSLLNDINEYWFNTDSDSDDDSDSDSDGGSVYEYE